MSGSMALKKENSWRLEDGYNMLTISHQNMIKENEQYTFIFEYISLKDAHVVLYNCKQEGLYLIGIRNVYTGQQLSYNEIKDFANRYDVKMTNIETTNIKDVLNNISKYKASNKEGWVINIDGHMIKIKCDDYVQLHRILDKISSINLIIQNIANDTYDDLISKVPESYKDRVQNIAKLIFDYIKEANQNINYYYNLAPKENKKDYMIYIQQKTSKEIQAYLIQKYLGKEYNLLKTYYGKSVKYKKLNELGIDVKYSALFADLEDNEHE
jgi:hypothetical protein